MIRLLPVLLLASCASAEPAPPAPLPDVRVVELEVEVPRDCRSAKPEWFKTSPKAEGSILHVFEVASDRGKQVDQLRAQIAAIHAELKKGCLSL